jgi:hypothetical protein
MHIKNLAAMIAILACATASANPAPNRQVKMADFGA